jgi:dTDP-glucose 4,6-dehydratase
MNILVTCDSGFIGANVVLDWLGASDESIINLDKLAYAGSPERVLDLQSGAYREWVSKQYEVSAQ